MFEWGSIHKITNHLNLFSKRKIIQIHSKILSVFAIFPPMMHQIRNASTDTLELSRNKYIFTECCRVFFLQVLFSPHLRVNRRHFIIDCAELLLLTLQFSCLMAAVQHLLRLCYLKCLSPQGTQKEIQKSKTYSPLGWWKKEKNQGKCPACVR